MGNNTLCGFNQALMVNAQVMDFIPGRPRRPLRDQQDRQPGTRPQLGTALCTLLAAPGKSFVFSNHMLV